MNRRSNDEPVRGLPERLPAGERIVWQGAPDWKSLARRLFRFRGLLVYFALLAIWRGAVALDGGQGAIAVIEAVALMAVLTVLALAILTLLAWLIARTTVYTITDRRIVIRFGVALPMTINFPFGTIGSVDLRTYPDGTGDIPFTLLGRRQVAYFNLWPHARPWKLRQPQPMLRAVPEAARVVELLADRMTASAAAEVDRTAPQEPVPAAARDRTAAKPGGASTAIRPDAMPVASN